MSCLAKPLFKQYSNGKIPQGPENPRVLLIAILGSRDTKRWAQSRVTITKFPIWVIHVTIRKCTQADFDAVLRIINQAAHAYKGVIPTDRWHEPYMVEAELHGEIADGVVFWGVERDTKLKAVMGFQDKREVALIRHAYVIPEMQRQGLGTRLLRHVESLSDKPVLVGTWSDAPWAISFYEKNGYTLLPSKEASELLGRYWSIPARQVETSVVLRRRAHGRWK